MRIGAGRTRGYGQIESCQLSRDFESEEKQVSSPIHRIFRKANISIIDELSKNPGAIDNVEWRDLEKIMAQIFEEIGFDVKLTDASHDGGKDIVHSCLTTQNNEITTRKFYVEIKHWKTAVGIGPVQKLIQVSEKDLITGSIFVSTSGFATKVTENAEIRYKVKLEDLSNIYTFIRYFQKSRIDELISLATLEDILNTENL